MKKYYFFFLILTIIMAIACGDEEEPTVDPPTCETSSLTYTNDIAAIFNSSCSATSACHGQGSLGTFEMDNYANTKVAVDFGRISGAINHRENFSPMPRGGSKLDDCTIDKIDQWIADGAPE